MKTNPFAMLFEAVFPRQRYMEDYLNGSTSIADLERRQREVLRARFAGW